MFSQDGSEETIRKIISRLKLKPPVIVKPNWSGSEIFTESKILDWTLSALDDEVVVVESYAHYRSKLLLEHKGPIDDEFERKLMKQKRSDFRENDKWFLEFSGVKEVLEKHSVEYLNLSEELWANRLVDSELIKKDAESRFNPVTDEIFYSMVPSRLYDLIGGTLLSLAKPKIAFKAVGVSHSIKNLFGMIPSPWRGKFHGEDHDLLDESIVNINKIYRSLFDVKGVVEGIFTTSNSQDSLLDPVIYSNQGCIWGSSDTLELDALITSQIGIDPRTVGHLKLAAESFGIWTPQVIESGLNNPIVFTSSSLERD